MNFLLLTILSSVVSSSKSGPRIRIDSKEALASMVGFWESEKNNNSQYKAIIHHDDKYHSIWWPKNVALGNFHGSAELSIEDGWVVKKWENKTKKLAWTTSEISLRLDGTRDIQWYWEDGRAADAWSSCEEVIPPLPAYLASTRLAQFERTIEQNQIQHNSKISRKLKEAALRPAKIDILAQAKARVSLPKSHNWQTSTQSPDGFPTSFDNDDFPQLPSAIPSAKASTACMADDRLPKTLASTPTKSTVVNDQSPNTSAPNSAEQMFSSPTNEISNKGDEFVLPTELPSLASAKEGRNQFKRSIARLAPNSTSDSMVCETQRTDPPSPSAYPPPPACPPPPPPASNTPTKVPSEYTFDEDWGHQNGFEISRYITSEGKRWCLNRTNNTWFFETHVAEPVNSPELQGFDCWSWERKILCWNADTGAFFSLP